MVRVSQNKVKLVVFPRRCWLKSTQGTGGLTAGQPTGSTVETYLSHCLQRNAVGETIQLVL
jgi:hypothetical protein